MLNQLPSRSSFNSTLLKYYYFSHIFLFAPRPGFEPRWSKGCDPFDLIPCFLSVAIGQ